MLLNLNKNDFTKILIFSFVFVMPKWFLSYYFFDEDITSKIINEIHGDGEFYLPLVKYFGEFNFSQSFNTNIENLNPIPVPFGSLFLHSIFNLLFGGYSIIILEILFTFCFIYFLFITQRIYFNNKYNISISVLILLLPILITILGLDNFNFLNNFANNFFNFRIHRPIATTLLLIISIFLIIKVFQYEFSKRNGFFLGLTLGLTFSSFYYFFLIQAISLIILILIKYKFNLIKFSRENFKFLLIFLIGFLIPAVPFLYHLFISEIDYLERMGTIILDKDKKIILLNYYFEIFFNFKFLSFLIFNIALLIINIKINSKKYYFYIVPFCLFISSILSPIFFVTLSNKVSLMYHFNNNIILCSSIFIIFSFISIFNKLKFNEKSFNLFTYLIFVFIIFFKIDSYINKNYENKIIKSQRIEFSKITKKLLQNDLKNISILTLDDHITIWSIMNNVGNLKILNGLLTSKKNEIIEKEIIETFKFLKLDQNIFIEFIKNKDFGWRFYNKGIGKYFYLRYQANKLKTYNDTKDFTEKEQKKIEISSPALNQQIILPVSETARFIKLFDNHENSDYEKPDIIVFNKNNSLFQNTNLLSNKYCKIFNGNIYIVLSRMDCE